ncbi:hypothetical protein POTOM_023649 [Populus tomentosa]|uniref:Endonuclease/exonuclease/phosphatase domain-containing protein n=1 Tax=Populus tomentosa TaxID=118781 RepID=A0A8X8D163_POPTO|nr:hypothetical protein POTOM_023649 [Populus tomentosa]
MSVSLTVMTFNLHEDQAEDSPNSWEKRKDLCISVITNYSPMILCTQQGVKTQLDYLQQCLPAAIVVIIFIGNTQENVEIFDLHVAANCLAMPLRFCDIYGGHMIKLVYIPDALAFGRIDNTLSCQSYGQFGISRKGSQDASDEHCTIFYDKEKVELLEGGTFWLSESPSVPGSISWGAAAPCIATWAISFPILVLSILHWIEPPGFSFQIVNTNMDEFSPRARRRSALLTWQHIASLPPSLPVVYCGGFNTQKESTTGRFLLGRSRNEGLRPFDSSFLNDLDFYAETGIDYPMLVYFMYNMNGIDSVFLCREHGVVGDMRDTWPNARVRKNHSLIHTYHGFKGDKQGALEFFKLILRALCLCWDRQTQDLHVDWILFRGRSLIPALCEVVNDNIDGHYPSSHYPIFAEFMLPRSVRLLEPPPTQEENPVAV